MYGDEDEDGRSADRNFKRSSRRRRSEDRDERSFTKRHRDADYDRDSRFGRRDSYRRRSRSPPARGRGSRSPTRNVERRDRRKGMQTCTNPLSSSQFADKHGREKPAVNVVLLPKTDKATRCNRRDDRYRNAHGRRTCSDAEVSRLRRKGSVLQRRRLSVRSWNRSHFGAHSGGMLKEGSSEEEGDAERACGRNVELTVKSPQGRKTLS